MGKRKNKGANEQNNQFRLIIMLLKIYDFIQYADVVGLLARRFGFRENKFTNSDNAKITNLLSCLRHNRHSPDY